MTRANFIRSLYSEGAIEKEQLSAIISFMTEERKNEMQAIIRFGLLDNMNVAKAVAKRYSLKFISLREMNIDISDYDKLTSERLYELGAIPFGISDDGSSLKVAIADPTDLSVTEVLAAITLKKVNIFMALRSDINYAIDRAFSKEGSFEDELEDKSSDIDVVVLVRNLLSKAVRQNASDIHIEGTQEHIRVRYRIDGVLREHCTYKSEWLTAIVSRIKILAGIDIAEKRMAQDGKASLDIDSNEYDFRVSTIPTVFGEKVVIRIAPKRMVFTSKQQLGLLEEDVEKLDRIFMKNHGMVLVTGPTGCGKTTTLYSVLSELNTIEKNTITVEDPIEITISGINQVQVSATGGMTFSNALRAILRQDPDIIMIGEIRDKETAKVAIQSSVTGHLVLSTLHTNSAASTINRLVNMGVERYLISDALVAVIAQRLVRKLCPYCKKEDVITTEQADLLKVKADTTIYKKCGCDRCGNSGYLGRTSIFEILEITQQMREQIATPQFDTAKLQKTAEERGMSTLQDGARKLFLNGITSYDEMINIYTDREIYDDDN